MASCKKQIVKVTQNVNGGMYVLINGGLSMEDKIAFPYSKTAQEGVKTKKKVLWIRLWDMILHRIQVLVKEEISCLKIYVWHSRAYGHIR